MHCKHCFFIVDESDDVCPNCGKSLKDEPVVEQSAVVEPAQVEEQSDAIELPMKKVDERAALSDEDQFTANFIQKDDPLAHIDDIKKNATKTSKAMIASRIAALLAVVFFVGVLYYTKVMLPKINKELSEAEKAAEEADKTGYETTSAIADNKLIAEIDAKFGEETINTQLKNNSYEYSKEKQNVDVKLKYGTELNGTSFQILLKRTYSSGMYDDSVSFKYGDSSITGVIRTYSNYNEDLITNILNSYVVDKTNDLVVMYTKASTFQLGKPTTILLLKDGTYSKVDNVITTYSTDGVSITQCPITINQNSISYCSIKEAYEKSREMQINKIDRSLEGMETVKETTIGLVGK